MPILPSQNYLSDDNPQTADREVVARSSDISTTVECDMRPIRPSSKPFRFLKLPIELRMIVYEHLPEEFKYHYQTISTQKCPLLAIAVPTVGTSLLQTCRQIYNEAHDIVRKTNAQAPVKIVSTLSPSVPGYVSHVYFWYLAKTVCELAEALRSPYTSFPSGSIIRIRESDSLCAERILKLLHGDVKGGCISHRQVALALSLTSSHDMLEFVEYTLKCERFAALADEGIVIAIQGLDLRDCRQQFEDAGTLRRMKIVGVEGTPAVNWKEEWGVERLESLTEHVESFPSFPLPLEEAEHKALLIRNHIMAVARLVAKLS